jgi:alkaline phosphatase
MAGDGMPVAACGTVHHPAAAPRRSLVRRSALVLAAVTVPVAALLPSSLAATTVGRPAGVAPRYVTPSPVTPCTVDAVAAGDFDGTATDISKTGRLAVGENPDVAMLLGDIAYPDGTTAQIKAGIGATPWKTLVGKWEPAPGNHDYHTADAADYFAYFNPPGAGHYYAFGVGCGWRGYSLDSELAGVAAYRTLWNNQLTWLKNDLAAHPNDNIVVIWHKPRYSSGKHGDNSSVAPLWNALAGRTAVVLNGHDHDYERFAVKNGVQEFVVGTGGKAARGVGTTISSGSLKRVFGAPGVLHLRLSTTAYWWEFLSVDGRTLDEGGRATSVPFS